jgi:hypothetical protein
VAMLCHQRVSVHQGKQLADKEDRWSDVIFQINPNGSENAC